MQRLQVDLLVIKLALFPAAKDDPDPLVSQSPDCGGMGLLLSALAVIEALAHAEERVDKKANSWKVCRRNLGQERRKWTHSLLPLASLTGAMPL